ncbi:MAG: DUF4192 domain-containing protein [Kibdelosporangium sp.]
MTTTERTRIKLRDPGDLIAAVPYLLGFRPEESLVLAAHTGPSGEDVQLCVRADLPDPANYGTLAEQLKLPVLRANAVAVTVVVVCAGEPEPLPHQELADILAAVFGAAGVALSHALWTTAIEEGAPWWCYDDLECNGQVPDPTASELAVVSAANGVVTYGSRAELRNILEPADPQPVRRRAMLMADALRVRLSEQHAYKLIANLASDVRAGTLELDDDRVVNLAVALTHIRVRDHCLCDATTVPGRAMEQAWMELTRAMPRPYRAEPASLLAVLAFLRGDGALAGVALEAALEAQPRHMIAYLLRQSMDLGLPPAEVAAAIASGAREHAPDS